MVVRRYGYSFIKGSGADYKFSFIIEAIFFAGLLFLPFLVIFNPNHAKDIFGSFFLLIFVYGLFSILAEMLPKTSLYLSLLFATGLYITAVYNTVKYAFNNVFYYNIGVQTLYYSAIAFVTIYLIRKETTLSKIPK